MSVPPPFGLPPFALAMGMALSDSDGEAPVVTMQFGPHSEGRPGFLHGGAIGGLLEMAGFAALATHLGQRGIEQRMKPINISIEYLRAGLPHPLHAMGQVLRAGRRVANVRVEAWQTDRATPIASCWMNFHLSAPKS
ncbi:PaaI family thioesterase [Novosphingobium pokkalii]|uniref:PaaI family thioesterase n=1 Tax=Novosphingobium pokkalii TaxID=1770194 RepID=A0ABV7V7F0_9SPHN|nr:PaaI family thioesterase [Novosphingobium pokkalii]GHD00006.1 thioesterase [Novosphingobium pokkalii]